MPRLLASITASLACAALLLSPHTGASQQRLSQNPAATAPAGADFGVGDLLEFRLMADEALLLVKADDLPGAEKQIKALGAAWNDAEVQLRPQSPANWSAIDKAIETVTETFHARAPYAAASIAALDKLIATIESSQRQ